MVRHAGDKQFAVAQSLDMSEHTLRNHLTTIYSNLGLINRVRPSITRLARALVNRQNEPVPGERLLGSYSGESEVRPFLTCLQRDDAGGIAAATAADPWMIERRGPMLLLISAVRGKIKAAEGFLRFATEPIVVDLDDNGKAWLAANRNRIELSRLSPYSPEFNPIEGVWKQSKKRTAHNTFYRTADEREASADALQPAKE